MSTDAVAITGFIILFALMLARVPVGMALGLVGVGGFAYLVNGDAALKIVGHTSMRTVTNYTFGVIPMFILMGAFVTNSGMSRELFRAANGFLGLRLSRDAPLRLSPVLRGRRDRSRRHAGSDAAALDGSRGLRDHYRAGHRQALHRGNSSGHPRRLHVHDDGRGDRLGKAELSARGPARHLARAHGGL